MAKSPPARRRRGESVFVTPRGALAKGALKFLSEGPFWWLVIGGGEKMEGKEQGMALFGEGNRAEQEARV